jgi:hypothetical protein
MHFETNLIQPSCFLGYSGKQWVFNQSAGCGLKRQRLLKQVILVTVLIRCTQKRHHFSDLDGVGPTYVEHEAAGDETMVGTYTSQR